MSIATGAAMFFLAAWTQVAAANEAALPRSPAQLFGPLYEQVESARLYPDSKSFADAVPLRPPQSILADYEARKPSTPAELATFVAANFTLPPKVAAGEPQPVPPAASLEAHIKALWPLLSRPPLQAAPFSSQLSLSHPYVVPGGRFREIYYWDSYFTLLGLLQDGESAMARDLVANFTDLIERYGHVPNGARTYYLSRSQLPVFYLMVGLVPGDTPTARAQQLQALRTEYAFWMRGERELALQLLERRIAIPCRSRHDSILMEALRRRPPSRTIRAPGRRPTRPGRAPPWETRCADFSDRCWNGRSRPRASAAWSPACSAATSARSTATSCARSPTA